MFERYQAGEQAVLVHLDFPDESSREDLNEFKMLVSSAGVQALTVVTGKRNTPHPRFFVGSGKAEEIRDAVKGHAFETKRLIMAPNTYPKKWRTKPTPPKD